MWYDSSMPQTNQDDIIDEAVAAVKHAQRVRATHRRRTTKSSVQRQRDIEMALTRLREAMKPLRSELGRFPTTMRDTARHRKYQNDVRDASEAVQKERRKLWKMRTTP
jgi:hypothetical protein